MIAPVAVNVKLQEKKKSRCKRVLAGACSKAKQRETMLGCEGTARKLKVVGWDCTVVKTPRSLNQ